LSQVNYNINATQTFNLHKNWSADISAFYQSKYLDGISVIKGTGSLNAGIKKKLKDNKSSFVFNVTDIFQTMSYRFSTNLPEQNLVSFVDLRFSQRTYNLTYTHTFGNDKLKSKRERGTGAEDEKGRVH